MSKGSLAQVSTVNFLLNFAIQCSMIFIGLLGAELGATDFQVGLIGACYGSAYLLSSLYCGYQSDRRGRIGFVRAGLMLGTFAFAAQLLARSPLELMTARAAVGLALGMATATLVAFAYDSGADMGRFSSYGSLGWIAAALASALLKTYALLFLVSAICCAVALIPSFSFRAKARNIESSAVRTAKSFSQVVRSGFHIYLSVFLRHLGATAVWIILPLYLSSIGFDRFWVGVLWGINFAVQFLVMRCLQRFEPARIFAVGQVLSILVFVCYTLTRNLWFLIAIQMLLGVAWACLYVGALLLVLRTGEDRGTATGIFQATLNLCGAAGPFLGGIIAQYSGYRGVMFFAAGLGIVGLLVAVPRVKTTAAE